MKIQTCLYYALILLVISQTSCVTAENEFSKLPPGTWRGVLNLDDTETLDEKGNVVQKVSEAELPFNFEVVYNDDESFFINIMNGSEVIKVDDIAYGRDRSTAKDTVLIKFPVFDTYIKAIYQEGTMQGHWHVPYRDNYKIPFVAYFGQKHRFKQRVTKPDVDLDGQWKAAFEVGKVDEYPAIADFNQDKNVLTGTFKTETGDYRFLEGDVYENRFALSCFDGAHAFLFEGKVQEDGKLIGEFRSGAHYKVIWQAEKDEDFKLASAYELTKRTSDDALSFTFPNQEGKMISIDDEQYQGKVKLIKIMGTWCPNCKDETRFILDYLDNNPSDQYEVITIAFERYRDAAKSMEVLHRFKEKMKIPYEVLLGGYFDKKEAVKQLPMLSEIISYPTLLYVDRQNQIRKIYTGFAGPATDEYERFTKEFESTLNQLIAE